jgi:UDP-GlcNAc3NAcA epimerase
MKIVSIVGARPQFIKAAAVSRILRNTLGMDEILVHTGQHYDDNMSAIFFKELEIPQPAYNLAVGSETHGAQTGRMLESIESVLLKERPDGVVVYGDTNTTLAGALAAVKLHIPLAHVEAGMRSYNRLMPEEINRVLTDHISEILFASTKRAVNNLLKEGISEERIHFIGDIMYDTSLFYGQKAEQRSDILKKLMLESKKYILATIHRAENTDDPRRLRAIFDGLCEASRKFLVVIPLHPRTYRALNVAGLFRTINGRILIIEPVGYLDIIMLEKNACLIATDSGGVQKEAFFYRVPCVTLREETEWVELVELGWNKLIQPDDSAKIVETILSNIDSVGNEGNPYGEGRAAETIVHILYSLFGGR